MNTCKYPSLSYVAVKEKMDIARIEIVCLWGDLQERYTGLLDSDWHMFEENLLEHLNNFINIDLYTLKFEGMSNIVIALAAFACKIK